MITEEIYKKMDYFYFIEVSNLGNVRSTGGHYLITECKGRPYLVLKAQKEILAPMLRRHIHIIVADLFLGRQEEIERRSQEKYGGIYRESVTVCHIDDDPQNKRVDNLYLGTPKTNAEDAKRNRLLKKSQYAIL